MRMNIQKRIGEKNDPAADTMIYYTVLTLTKKSGSGSKRKRKTEAKFAPGKIKPPPLSSNLSSSHASQELCQYRLLYTRAQR